MAEKISYMFLERPYKILNFYSIWPRTGASKYEFLRKVATVVLLIMQNTFFLSEITYIIRVWGDFDEVSEASYLFVTQALICYKTMTFLINAKSLLKLLQYMDSEIFRPRSSAQRKLLANMDKKAKSLCLLFFIAAVITCTLWTCIPLIEASSGNRTFPYRAWMPISPLYSPGYELGYLWQTVMMFTSAFLFSGIDSVAVTMMLFGCAELEIIMDKLNQILSVPYSSTSPSERIELWKSNNELLIECIKQHQTVISFIELLEDTFHTNIFFQLAGTAAIICNVGLRFSVLDTRSLQFVSIVTYLSGMLVEVYQYCWCGHELTARSEVIRDWLYLCPWHQQDAKFARTLCIAMERMKCPIVLRAGHYIPLCRPTFVSLLRCSYSYFAVLNSVNDKE